MKRHTTVSRPPSAAPQEPAHPSAPSESCTAAIESTAALLAVAMQESEEPIAALGTALVRIGRTLADIGAPVGGKPVPGYPPQVQAGLASIARDIAVCIESLQFHDRLTQTLTQVGHRLGDLGARPAPLNRLGGPGAAPAPQSASPAASKGSVELF